MYHQDSETAAPELPTPTDTLPAGASRGSFFLHLRPRRYPAESIRFRHTLHLGFWATFLLALETLTGILLMVYYVPTPEGAYASLQRLLTAVPFGGLCRDLHRLGGDLLIVAAVLHLLRVIRSGACTGPRRFTWVSGVLLLLVLLALAFSGYLLPWDQLSYWAVTVGTSLLAAIPLVGGKVQMLLRGGSEIGADGLLRFYALHVVILPVFALLLFAVHYYRLARLHGVSLPAGPPAGSGTARRSLPLLPDMVHRELLLIIAGTLALLVAVSFVYDAPLGLPADPRQTPGHTTAPWFFLWIQGLLTLGPPLLTGILLPAALLLVTLLFPYLLRDGAGERRTQRKIFAASVAILLIMGVFSLIGDRRMLPAATGPEALLESLLAEGTGQLPAVEYADLRSGVYPLPGREPAAPAALARAVSGIGEGMDRIRNAGACSEISGLLIIEPIQEKMKRAIVRLSCTNGDAARTSHERMLFVAGSQIDPADQAEAGH